MYGFITWDFVEAAGESCGDVCVREYYDIWRVWCEASNMVPESVDVGVKRANVMMIYRECSS